jgi:hypothetical protein
MLRRTQNARSRRLLTDGAVRGGLYGYRSQHELVFVFKHGRKGHRNNVPIDGHASGLGAIHHRPFAMACDEMDRTQFTAFLRQAFRNLAAFSVDGALHYICMDWRHLDELLAAGRDAYGELKNLCVRVKDNAGMGSLSNSPNGQPRTRFDRHVVFISQSWFVPHGVSIDALGERHAAFKADRHQRAPMPAPASWRGSRTGPMAPLRKAFLYMA